MAKRRSGEDASRARAGRKPGVWKYVTPEQLREFRTSGQVSRARIASALGVSSTSVQNWESGRAAMPRLQRRLAELIAAGPGALEDGAPDGDGVVADGPVSGVLSSQLLATGTIVGSYITAHGKMSHDQLMELIRSVRSALRE
jgi:DNA-binding transcriptional regulator YiaG